MNAEPAAGGKVVVNRTMSLDGYVAGPGDAMDWVFEYAKPGDIPEVMAATGAMLCGRRSYDVGQRDAGKLSGEAYGGLWSGPVFVLTHRPPPGGSPDPAVSFLSGDITAAVGTAKAAAGGKDVEIIGTDVATQCLHSGLVDEIFVIVLPVLLGGGTPLISPAGLDRVNLEPVSSDRTGPVTSMRFRLAPCAS
jgi:dihydrofolate reductase